MVKHGGLSRAGKVKRQTPRVAVEDKPKAATGRSKKRAQYNRRMNAPTKRGPNSSH